MPKGEIKYDSAGSGNPSRGGNAWKLPIALAITVLLGWYAVRIQVMWRQGAITTAIVIAGSLPAHSKMGGVESGLRRVSEVDLRLRRPNKNRPAWITGRPKRLNSCVS